MAATVPASLKAPDIMRFAHRAAQLEKAKPVISYWCNYWIVNHILSKGLHSTDAESLSYTTNLMDQLEQFKLQNSTNDAVVDDLAGKIYVEQFGLETFERADNAIRANKATRQTADTFQAAATFLELLTTWGPLEPENAAKVKYAKFHALRIAKAIKAGEDPNLSNPKLETAPEEALPDLDPNDAEVQALQGTGPKSRQPSVIEIPDDTDKLHANLARTSSLDQSLHPSRDPSVVRQQRQPSVVDVPDEAHRLQSRLAQQSSQDESLHPSRAPSIPRPATDGVSPLAPADAASFYTGHNQNDVSPMESAPSRTPSIGGNYFPVTPSAPTINTYEPPPFDLPSAPSNPTLPEPPKGFAPDLNTEGHFIPPALPGQTPQIPPNLAPNPSARQQLPQAPPQLFQPPTQPQQPQTYTTNLPGTAAMPYKTPLPQSTLTPSAPPANLVTDEEAIMKAQKHARWAISALNFEDVPTAVKELEGALRVLGAR